MVNKPVIPDAWDDDWESQADKEEGGVAIATSADVVKVTRAERLAQHAETNKKIWDSAEEPETFHFLAARDTVPLKSEFKPALKVLSRKPTPKRIQKIDPITGLSKMSLEDDDDEVVQTTQPTPEELRFKAQREREEKQKRYDEVRARIMGTPLNSGGNSPGAITPPIVGEGSKPRGKGRNRDSRQQDNLRSGSQHGVKDVPPGAHGQAVQRQ
ncbi:hypothetical protein M7I_2791 [Glarea lozoyensis 74030]|uniref:SUZ domain-containing protein n=1 Tax=Glarea lozoyensis (strain ATCC 74030 / MF5533) TaxID=1104152 RepID=H0EJR1_GLAL7|nr:hypothetical protein M7I_2791 [Glarea lozoyensis 74030]